MLKPTTKSISQVRLNVPVRDRMIVKNRVERLIMIATVPMMVARSFKRELMSAENLTS